MSRLIATAGITIVLLLAARPPSDRFMKYKTVEAYEIRPGILMMPRYSDDGQVCEIGLERQHYSSKQVRLDSSLSKQDIDGIVDELIPPDERGARSKAFGDLDLIVQGGKGRVTSAEFENVIIQVYGDGSPKCNEGNIVAMIRWKLRRCR